MELQLKAFYSYNDSVFFYRPLVRTVFNINQQGYEVAYAWDFGNLNPEKTKLDKNISHEEIVNMYKNAQIKGVFNEQCQNNNYYYTRFVRCIDQDLYNPLWIYVFYDKRDNTKYIFEKFKEDLYFFPIFWCDEYVLASSHTYLKKVVDKTVLDDENIKKLESIEEEDNPFIIKYYFK